MYDDWTTNLVVVAATIFSVGVVVLAHYEGLSLLSRLLAVRQDRQRRRKILYGIFGVLGLHIIEIWIFGVTAWAVLTYSSAGYVAGSTVTGLLDAVYLSAVTYTTVGFGDLAPVGPIRFMCGTIALTGFVLITWSASFTYLEMERFWRR